MSSRLRIPVLIVALTLCAASCERITVGSQIAAELRDGRRYAAALVERERAGRVAPADTALVIALGYLERERLGMGSPFRLIDYVQRDPRLDDSTRRALSWALLARTLDGDDHAVWIAALDSLEGRHAALEAPGRAQLGLIVRAVQAHDDPRSGELAVRLAYTIAASAHDLSPAAPMVAAEVAAQVRDGVLARQDARNLLRAAYRGREDPLLLLSRWRRARAFAVERAVIDPVPAASELEALEMVPSLVAELERPEGGDDRAGRAAGQPLLAGSAGMLEALARAEDAPPRAAVVVTIGSRRIRLLHGELLDSAARAARFDFVTRARDEESLAAEHALAAQLAPGIALERATLAAAVALRTESQETPWFPGDAGPTDRELARRYGIAAVAFDPRVPPRNRPFYRRMLASALDDLRRVLPELDVTGLRVNFAESPLGYRALAMHDPRGRVLYLPPGTAAGAIAHELAHDADWQAARRRYDVGGDYATDRAVRAANGNVLAASLRGLAEASLGAAAVRDSGLTASSRPTEVFARNVDWLTAAALGRDGRLDGYLSSVQDGLLSGYASAAPPDAGGGAAVALVHVLDDVSPLDPDVRAWYLGRFGPGRRPDAYGLVRRVLGAPMDSAAAADSVPVLTQLVMPLRRTLDSAAVVVRAAACNPEAAGDGHAAQLEAARLRLLELAAGARAVGILRRHASVLAGDDLWRQAASDPPSRATYFSEGCTRADDGPFGIRGAARR